MASHGPPGHRGGGTRDRQDLPGSVLRHESALATRHGLLLENLLRESGPAGGQSVPLLVVVSNRVHAAGRLRAEHEMVTFFGYQLSRQPLDKRPEACRRQGCRWHICYLRI